MRGHGDLDPVVLTAAAPTSAGRGRRALQAALLALASLALSLLAFEVGARLVARPGAFAAGAPSDRELWVYHPTLGWLHRANAVGRSTLGGPDQGIVRINSLGLRGREVARRKPEGVRRVLVLGDSFVFGVGVDEEHAFSAQLERLLNTTGSGFEVVNMGVSGYSTDQEYLLAQELGPVLSPDLVLLVVCDNDFLGNTEDFAYGRYYKPYFEPDAGGALVLRNTPVPRLSGGQEAKLWLTERSALWGRLRSLRSRAPAVEGALGFFQIGRPRPSSLDPVEITFALVAAVKRLADGWGAAFLTMNTGHRGEKTQLFHALRPKLDAAHIDYVGAEAALGKARQVDPERDWDFKDDTHWNVDSHRLAAKVVHSHLRTTLLADRLRDGAPAGPRGSSRP